LPQLHRENVLLFIVHERRSLTLSSRIPSPLLIDSKDGHRSTICSWNKRSAGLNYKSSGLTKKFFLWSQEHLIYKLTGAKSSISGAVQW
jgi:hypothetical protein